MPQSRSAWQKNANFLSLEDNLRFKGDVLENLGEQGATASDLAGLNGLSWPRARSTAPEPRPDAPRPPQPIIRIASDRQDSINQGENSRHQFAGRHSCDAARC
jgi:hypothetical protein